MNVDDPLALLAHAAEQQAAAQEAMNQFFENANDPYWMQNMINHAREGGHFD